MNQSITKNYFYKNIENNSQVLPQSEPSEFNTLYDQAFKQIKHKFGKNQQNLPLIRMKSYQNPQIDFLKIKDLRNLSQRSQKLIGSSLSKLIPSTIRKKPNLMKKDSVNKILWQKKMSLQILRSRSGNQKQKHNLAPKQMPQKLSLRHLRQHTTIQCHQDVLQDQQQLYKNHIYISPVSLSSRQPKQSHLKTKQDASDKFKTTFSHQFQESQQFKTDKHRIIIDLKKKQKNLKSKMWEIDKEIVEEDHFVSFVNQMKRPK